MKRYILALVGVAFLVSGSTVALAFLDDLSALREELAAYQVTHAADLNDVVEKLNDIGGPSFKDVSEKDWFHQYIASVAAWGIVSGYKDQRGNPTGEFGPQNNVTMAEALKMIMKSKRVEEADCLRPALHPQAKGHWSERYVSCAEEFQVRLFQTSGFPDLNRPAQRAEVVALLNDIFGDDVPPLYASFSDTQNHLFEPDIAYAVALGVVSGDKDDKGALIGTFRPDEAVNRAEVAKIIYARLRTQVREETAL